MARLPYLCGGCGRRVEAGATCPCQLEANRQRKARHDRNRPSARARGYDSAWDKARLAFLAQHPTCALCAAPATTVDHIIPHKGDKALFWLASNWQSLCTPCHSRHKQRQERQL